MDKWRPVGQYAHALRTCKGRWQTKGPDAGPCFAREATDMVILTLYSHSKHSKKLALRASICRLAVQLTQCAGRATSKRSCCHRRIQNSRQDASRCSMLRSHLYLVAVLVYIIFQSLTSPLPGECLEPKCHNVLREATRLLFGKNLLVSPYPL